MTPLALIKQDILKGNLKLVEEGYTALTGETVTKNQITKAKPISKTPISNEEEIDEFIEDPDEQFKRQVRSEQQQQTKELEDGTVQIEARRETVDLSKIGAFNMFEDDGETSAEYKDEDRAVDKKSSTRTQVGRRKEVKKVTATCSDCHKIFKVLPVHQSEGSFTCTKCIKRN